MIKTDIVIIGSGISSLTCAALLARQGKSVIVLEQYSKPGGYLHCFKRFGERFDTGAHYVGAMGEGQPFQSLLKYLNVYDESLFIPLASDGFDVFEFPDFSFRLPVGYEAAIAAMSEQFPSEESAIRQFFKRIRQATEYFPTYEFKDENRLEIPKGIFETSLASVVTSLTQHSGLQCLLYSYCALHGTEPWDVAFGFHAIMMDSLIRGPYGMKQGGDLFAQRFVNEIERQGGKVLLKQQVTQLQVQDHLIKQVVTQSGEVYQSEWVISGIHPKAAFRLLSDASALSPAFRQRLSETKETLGLFGISAHCQNAPDFIDPLRNYYLFSSQDPKLCFRAGHSQELPGAVFLSAARRQWLTEESAAPSRSMPVNLHAAGPIEWFAKWRDSKPGQRPEEYKTLKKHYAENIFQLVEQFHPGFKASVSEYATSSPLTNLHFNGSEDGSAYGIYHGMENTGPRAIGPRTKLGNFLLTGQSTLFPGLLGAATSGLRTAGHILGMKPMLRDLMKIKGGS